MKKRMIALLAVLSLFASQAVVLAASVPPLAVAQNNPVQSLTAYPYVVHAGEEVSISATLDLIECPEEVSITYSEIGPNPQEVTIDLARNPETDRYEGKHTFPEVISKSMGLSPTRLSYTVVNYSGQQEKQYSIASTVGGFFVLRPKVRLLSWDLSNQGVIGSTVTMNLQFDDALPFESPVRVVFQSRNSAELLSFQTEPLQVGPEGIMATATAKLPPSPGSFEARYLRVGSDLLPLFGQSYPNIEAIPQTAPTPELESLAIDQNDQGFQVVNVDFKGDEGILGARLQLIGPYHHQSWVQLSQPASGDWSVALTPEELPFTGTYTIVQVAADLRSGNTVTFDYGQLAQMGTTSLFHIIEPHAQPPVTADSEAGTIHDVIVTPGVPGVYDIVIRGDANGETPLVLTFAGNRNTYNVSCDRKPESDQWEGELLLPDWTPGGAFLLARATTVAGEELALSRAFSFGYIATNADKEPPVLKSIRSSFTYGVGVVNVALGPDQSGVRAVRLYYTEAMTKRPLLLNATEKSPGLWQASRVFQAMDQGKWILAGIQVVDAAGNVTQLGSGGHSEPEYPSATIQVSRTSLDVIAPTIEGATIQQGPDGAQVRVTVRDVGTGVDIKSLTVQIDEAEVPVLYNQTDNSAVTMPIELNDGGHALVVLVTDKAGNVKVHTQRLINMSPRS